MISWGEEVSLMGGCQLGRILVVGGSEHMNND